MRKPNASRFRNVLGSGCRVDFEQPVSLCVQHYGPQFSHVEHGQFRVTRQQFAHMRSLFKRLDVTSVRPTRFLRS